MDDRHDPVNADESALWEAYRGTTFETHIENLHECLRIRIGEHTPQLDKLLEEYGAKDWIFITAWNPGRERPGREANDHRNGALRNDLESRGSPIFPGLGRGSDPAWEPEESFLALGIESQIGIEIGRRYGQFAIVAGASGQPARLVDCRPAPACQSSAR